ncbi:MAG: hypothetical protein ACP5L4_07200, partial [Thermoplasmata archaeon]
RKQLNKTILYPKIYRVKERYIVLLQGNFKGVLYASVGFNDDLNTKIFKFGVFSELLLFLLFKNT